MKEVISLALAGRENTNSTNQQDDLLSIGQEYDSAGFCTVGKQMMAHHYRYLKITPEHIGPYLKNLYAKKTDREECYVDCTDDNVTFKLQKHCFNAGIPYGYTKFCWAETPIQAYPKIPPDHIIEKAVEARKRHCFDQLVIAEVLELKDPLLLGRIIGCETRYFLGQWDDDILLDDII